MVDREPERSISSDRTSDTDLTTAAEVHGELLRLSAEVSARVRSRGLLARTVGIKIRFADFTTVTRVRTLAGWVDSTDAIHSAAVQLYRGLDLDRPRIRLVGVKCENLRESATTAEQLSLDLDAGPTSAAVDAVADAAAARFGHNVLTRASLLASSPRPDEPER